MRRHRLHRRRYGHSHPLLPRLVMYVEKRSPTHVAITGKLQRSYMGSWENVVHHTYGGIREAREALHHVADITASKYNVPASHVEFA